MVWTGRGVSPPARRRTSPRRGSGGSRVSLVGRRAGLRAVSQSGPARSSSLQVSRWLSMELALAGRGRVDVGVCSVVGWTRMFGTGGARRMLSRMFGGEDAGLSLGDLSGGARAFQPGHVAKFAQGPRRSGQTLAARRQGPAAAGSSSSHQSANVPKRGGRTPGDTRRTAPTTEATRGPRTQERTPAGRPTANAPPPARTNEPGTTDATPPDDPAPGAQRHHPRGRHHDERTRRENRHSTPPREI